MRDPVRDTILETIEASLEAQLAAVRRLRKAGESASMPPIKRGRSQIDLAHDVLSEAGGPLHLKEIVERIRVRFGVEADPDSLGSALTKKVVKEERFRRVAKNTFAVRGDPNAG